MPLLLAAIAGLGFLLGSSDSAFRSVLEATARLAPGSVDTIADIIRKVIEQKAGVGLIALASLVWTGSAVFGVLEYAMDAAWRVEMRRGFVHSKLRGAVLVIVSGLALLLSLLLTSLARLHGSQLQTLSLGGLAQTPGFWRYVTVVIQFTLSVCAFTVLLRLVPNRTVPLACALQGGILTGVLWETSKHLFTLYVTRIAPYSGMYGPIGGLIAFVVWTYYSASVLLLGAEFAAGLATPGGPSRTTIAAGAPAGARTATLPRETAVAPAEPDESPRSALG